MNKFQEYTVRLGYKYFSLFKVITPTSLRLTRYITETLIENCCHVVTARLSTMPDASVKAY